ncbi:autotransporter-associated beta strand repeat-containing protein [Bradyrhizobium diazoefficiens]|nr:autotransporter-associated beta strand repeat-containing protein [Bradyrhizobium diazoefficiens]
MQSGGTVAVQGDLSQTTSSVSGGTGLNGGGNGSAFGSGIFFQGTGGTSTVLGFGSGNQSIANGITDYIGSGGSNPGGGTNAADQGGSVAITKSNGGTLTLSGANTYSGGTTINEGTTLVVGNGTALGSGALTLNGGTTGVTVNFNGSFSVGNNIVATGDPTYNVLTGNTVNLTGVLSGSGDVVVNEANGYAGTLILSGANTYSGPTIVDAGTLQAGSTSAFGSNSAVTVAGGAVLDLAGFSNVIGSLAGAGTVSNSGGAATLIAGGDNTSKIFSGTIRDGAGSLALTKTGDLPGAAGRELRRQRRCAGSRLRAHHGFRGDELAERLVRGGELRRRVLERHPQLRRQGQRSLRLVGRRLRHALLAGQGTTCPDITSRSRPLSLAA